MSDVVTIIVPVLCGVTWNTRSAAAAPVVGLPVPVPGHVGVTERFVEPGVAPTYDTLFERFNSLGPFEAETRYRRGLLLEKSGRWELARGEFRTLAAIRVERNPSHFVLGISKR